MNETNVEQATNTAKEKKVSIKDFIQENLFKTIEMLKDNGHPYFAFEIIAAGIEFLGACIDSYDFDEPYLSKIRFSNALETMPPLQKYKDFDLYKNLRCGMCHILTPKPALQLSSGSGKCTKKILYIENFYTDFKDACKEVMNAPANSKLWGKRKTPDDIWWIVKELPNTPPATAVTNNNDEK